MNSKKKREHQTLAHGKNDFSNFSLFQTWASAPMPNFLRSVGLADGEPADNTELERLLLAGFSTGRCTCLTLRTGFSNFRSGVSCFISFWPFLWHCLIVIGCGTWTWTLWALSWLTTMLNQSDVDQLEKRAMIERMTVSMFWVGVFVWHFFHRTKAKEFFFLTWDREASMAIGSTMFYRLW
jgi:hypothetical protein